MNTKNVGIERKTSLAGCLTVPKIQVIETSPRECEKCGKVESLKKLRLSASISIKSIDVCTCCENQIVH